MSETVNLLIRQQLGAAQNITLVSHIRPDGDAVGSMLALAAALRAAGKQVNCVLQDSVQQKFMHLPGAEAITSAITAPYDYLVVLDASDSRRAGTVLEGHRPDLVVDHHKTHEDFGKIDLVEPEAEATALMLYAHLPAWGLEINSEVAACLLTGILADTLGFRTSNTSPGALRAAAHLMDLGADLPFIYHQTLLTRTVAEMRYWARGLGQLQAENAIIWSVLSLDDRIKAGYPDNDDADLINILSSISGYLMSIIFVEQTGESVKVSWRSVEGVDVSGLAEKFGGGGHAAAAGADIPGDLPGVVDAVLKESRAYLGVNITD